MNPYSLAYEAIESDRTTVSHRNIKMIINRLITSSKEKLFSRQFKENVPTAELQPVGISARVNGRQTEPASARRSSHSTDHNEDNPIARQSETALIRHLTKTIDRIVKGESIEDIPQLISTGNEELDMLSERIDQLSRQYSSSYQFIGDLARGRLDTAPPLKSSFANQYIQLHSELQHLNWQMKEIAGGNYTHRINFMGDFSDAVNTMIESLREKDRLDIENHQLTERYRLVAENIVESVWLFDVTNKKPRYISPSVYKMRGVTAEEAYMEGASGSMTQESAQVAEAAIHDVITRFNSPDHSGEPIEHQLNFQQFHANGSVLDIESSVKLFKESTSGDILALGVSRDVTERKRLERTLKEKNVALEYANRAKDTFFSIIAHDLKNPFNGLMGVSNLLQIQLENNNIKEAKELASIIQSSSLQGFKLLNNLLDWTRMNSGRIDIKIENINLRDLINENIALLSANTQEKQITIHFDPSMDTTAFSDRNMLNTIIRNLLNNAIKYSHRNGKIELALRNDNCMATIQVKDNGIGIESENLEKLFRIDASFRQKGTLNEQGTGLGLVLCRDFVNQLGGEISVESTPGMGTTFEFTVPLV